MVFAIFDYTVTKDIENILVNFKQVVKLRTSN